MPASQFSYQNYVDGGVASPVSTEGIVCTTRQVSSAFAGCQFGIRFTGRFVAGAGTTAVSFRIRETSVSGTLIASFGPLSIVAANDIMVSFETVDGTLAEVASFVWVLTAQQTGGTGAGSFANAFSSVTVPV